MKIIRFKIMDDVSDLTIKKIICDKYIRLGINH